MIGGQSSQDGDQLSATLKRLEVRPVNLCRAWGSMALMCRDLAINHGFAQGLPHGLLSNACYSMDEGLMCRA